MPEISSAELLEGQAPLPPLEERIGPVFEALQTERTAELSGITAPRSSGETAASLLEALPLPARHRLRAQVPEDRRGGVRGFMSFPDLATLFLL